MDIIFAIAIIGALIVWLFSDYLKDLVDIVVQVFSWVVMGIVVFVLLYIIGWILTFIFWDFWGILHS